MYERFTDRSRKVMELANEEAEKLGSDVQASEHILLGLIRERAGVAGSVLTNLGVEYSILRSEVTRLNATCAKDGASANSFSTARFVENSLAEAAKLNHHYVGTEHMLLALLLEPPCRAGMALTNLGLSIKEVRAEILSLLGHGI